MSQRKEGGGKRKRLGQKRQEDEEEEEMETQSQPVDGSEGSTGTGGGGGGSSRSSQMAQRTLSNMDTETIDRKVGEIVRYLLCAEQRKQPVKRKELVEKVIGSEYSRAFAPLMSMAADKLSQVFGVSLREVTPVRFKPDGSRQQTSVQYFILSNQITADKQRDLLPCSEAEKREMALLFVVLAMVMLKDGSLQEEHLWNILKRLNITNRPHHNFGDVHKLIAKDFIEQRYLERERQAAGEQYRFVYRWGPKADATVDKKELLRIVAELHGNSVTQWEKHFAHLLDSP